MKNEKRSHILTWLILAMIGIILNVIIAGYFLVTAAIAHEKSRDVGHVLTIAVIFVGTGKFHCYLVNLFIEGPGQVQKIFI